MYLVFDTETTGLPKNWKATIDDLDNWPRLVQIAWLVFDEEGQELSSQCRIIKPQGFEIPEDATRIHGISTKRASRDGVELNAALDEFSGGINRSEFLVAHNMKFDEMIVGAEFLRQGIDNCLQGIPKICTQEKSTYFCRLPNPRGYGYKWPKLSELHRTLFGHHFEDAHDAMVDARACAKCFFELKRRNLIIN